MVWEKERIVSEDTLDVKNISEKLEALPYDKLMYVAGAITALAAVSKAQPTAVQSSA